MDFQRISQDVETIIEELLHVVPLHHKHILVLGVSTSEILGKHIGTSGSEQAAAALFQPLKELQQKHGFHLAFQGCEHINRAIVVEQSTAEQFNLDQVTVVPVPGAGGAMASYAYRHMDSPLVVEHIQAHAGIDIGDTFIGMHLKPVAVPVRPSIKQVGEAHVTMARTRPKLIGGARACYE